jgi:D-alanyl-D-alanine carboxypeptidase
MLAFGLALLFPTGPAHAQPEHAALVIDANTGAVLHEAAADAQRHPASLTKIMTLYLVFEQIEAGRLSYGSKIKISPEAAAAPPSKLDLDPGEEIEALAAIKALITKSANDIAIAIAEHIAGSELRFVQLMNQRARQLGMRNTHFRNASGLPDPGQVTTARDMITLALRLQDEYPRHYALFQTRTFAYAGSSYRNHNTLLFNFQGTEGIKTGYTRMSGFNLVASVKRNGRHLIGAVFGGGSAGARDAHMRMLLTRAFPRASTEMTRRSAPMAVARGRPVPQPVPAVRPRTEPKSEPRVVAAPSAPPPPMPVEIGRGRLASIADPGAEPAIVPPRPSRVMVPPRREAEASPMPSSREASLPWLKPSTAANEAPAPIAQRSRDPIPQPRASTAGIAPPPPVGGNTLTSLPGRGLPPSSLQAQAEKLALGGPGSNRFPPSVPALASTPPARQTGLEIQVGAYPTSGEAERQIMSVRSKSGALLQGKPPTVMPVRKDNRQLFRARFTGFDSQSAASACVELRRLAVDCLVMRTE